MSNTSDVLGERIGDGTCRGNDIARLLDLLEQREGWATVEQLASDIRRSVRYTHSLINESKAMTIPSATGRVARRSVTFTDEYVKDAELEQQRIWDYFHGGEADGP